MSVNHYNKDTGELVPIAKGTLYADAPIGSIIPYGGATAPSGWLLCQGQAVSRTTYADLFAAIGTAFGTGDGSTTFNVPDLRESAPVGVGENGTQTIAAHDVYTLGEFKDDQFQGHAHDRGAISGVDGTPGGIWNSIPGVIPTGSPVSDGTHGTPRIGTTTHGKQLGVNYIIKAKQAPVPADFMDAVNGCKILLPYELNKSSRIQAFEQKWLISGNSIVWTATHTGRLTIRCLKNGHGYSLYLRNQNSVMLDTYDNHLGGIVSEASITLQAWVRKGDVIELSTNLPANTEGAYKYFVQTGKLLYNSNYD